MVLAVVAAALLAAGPDGDYAGRFADAKDPSDTGRVTLTVAGRRISDLKLTPDAVCTNPNAIGGIEVVPTPVVFDRIRVRAGGAFRAKDGFVAGAPSGASQRVTVSGRLDGRRIKDGSLKLRGRCASTETFSARRK